MANLNIDDDLYDAFRLWVSKKHGGRTHGHIKRDAEAAIKKFMEGG